LDLRLRKTRSEKSYDYRNTIFFEKLDYQNVFRLHENEKFAFSYFSRLKSIFEKLRLRDGIVGTVGLTEKIKLHFEISPA